MRPSEGLEVHYIFPQFPVPSETFAALELARTVAAGARVQVHALKSKPGNARKLIRERKLSGIPVSWLTAGTLFHLLRLWGDFPAWGPLWTILSEVWTTDRRWFPKILAMLPRAYEIVRSLPTNRRVVLHAYWGHVPSVVLAVDRLLRPALSYRSTFLGAYDLEAGFTFAYREAAQSDVVWTISEGNVRKLQTLLGPGEHPIVLNYHGATIRPLLVKRTQTPGAFHLVSAGRFVQGKNMEVLIEVVGLLRQKGLPVRLTLMGDGPLRPMIEAAVRRWDIADSVVLPGHVPHDQVLERLATADLFMFLSTNQTERLPNAIKEAMVSGVPVMCTRTPDIEELILHGKTGFLLESSDPGEIAFVLEPLLKKGNADWAEIVAAAHKLVSDRFDIAVTGVAYVKRWSADIESRERKNARTTTGH